MRNTDMQFNEYFKSGNSLIFTKHFYEQMDKRGISVPIIYDYLKSSNLKLLQFHPPGTYLYLNRKYNKDKVYVLSSVIDGNKMHIVIAQKGNNYTGVSLYWPSKNVFDKNDRLLKH